ncbi:MAG: cupin domain-containing protein [Armatimonadota bacterium]|nr:cupin domain-containing protein [bacterium]MDW8321913.1 cupin domain-containing protein [Armatimonadota bacterium]
MDDSYLFLTDLAQQVEVPRDGILSRTLYQDEHVKVVLFGFDKGQDLSEHTASMPALLYFVQGEAMLTLGSDQRAASAGTWVYMTPNLPHSVAAKTPVVMLLILLRQQETRR